MITISPTSLPPIVIHSIAQYNVEKDEIQLWGWKENAPFYRTSKDEPFITQVARIIAHEEMHRILYFAEGYTTGWNYDFITQCDLDDLP